MSSLWAGFSISKFKLFVGVFVLTVFFGFRFSSNRIIVVFEPLTFNQQISCDSNLVAMYIPAWRDTSFAIGGVGGIFILVLEDLVTMSVIVSWNSDRKGNSVLRLKKSWSCLVKVCWM